MSRNIVELPTEASEVSNFSQEAVGEKTSTVLAAKEKHGISDKDSEDNPDTIIITGADAALHLLPLRDDFDSVLTLRSIILASGLACFQAVMNQIYSFKPTNVTIQGTFIVLISYFIGNAWANLLPRGDRLESRWREKGGQGKLPRWITVMKFVNNGPWSLKEHSICAITANSASNAAGPSTAFAAQKLFYDIPLNAVTVILTTVSIGLFGYGICGIMRPFAVWHTEAVYWTNLPIVKALQGLHWQQVKDSKPLRWFWYAFTGMSLYEIIPAYIFPWLNSVSIPCLASQKASGSTATVLTNVFGGATNNEGLGLFTLSFDWQYITSAQTSAPLKLQLHMALGMGLGFFVLLGIYYGNVWNSRSLPFMSTGLLNANGTAYPLGKVFPSGVLDEVAMAEHGLPKLTGTFAFALLMANAAIGALIMHCILFWGKDIRRAYKSARQGRYDDRHHEHMATHYQETPWWWYVFVLVGSFVLGIIVIVKENLTLPPWAYIVSLIFGCIIAPFSTILFSRFGNGIATNNLSKMLAGLIVPGRPIGNMYFAIWSHNVVTNAVNLSGDLKMGEYLKIPPRIMFLTQIYGTMLGAFINYAIMISIVSANRDLLVNSNGNSAWSGATIQSYNTNAASWALAPYIYRVGTPYGAVPIGIVIGAGAVVLHRLFYHFVPKIGRLNIAEINLPQFIQYLGYVPYNQSQTCVIFSQLLSGLYVQYYLRNYKPRIFKDYSYLVTAAFDGAALTVMFILSFAVFGAGGPPHPFPTWWGNNADGNYDWCPVTK